MRALSIPAILIASACGAPPVAPEGQPKLRGVVLLMADDQGWGDTGIAGHPVLRTPHLDQLAREGVRLERFYAAAPVCSPTRASVLTGRHPERLGIHGANVGHMPPEEITLAEALRAAGFRTGHFGKWHLGTLTTDVRDSNRGGPRGAAHYAPPWEHGFDVSFSTEAKVPTWDPMVHPGTGAPYGTAYWSGPGQRVEEGLEGDDSALIVDRVVPFLESAVREELPFLAVVWFHAPHLPVVSRAPYRDAYEALPDADFLGSVAALDAAVGRVLEALDALGVADETLVWYCSDNGPEIQGGQRRDLPAEAYAGSVLGSAGPLRGRKRSLHEGGIRVPGFVRWPSGLPPGTSVSAPLVTSDIYPTVCAAAGLALPEDRVLDAIDAGPVLRGQRTERGSSIGFAAKRQRAWIGDRWKLISVDAGETWQLYDLVADPAESRDLASVAPERVRALASNCTHWYADCRAENE